MLSYALARLLGIVPLLLAVVTITFFLMHAVDGGPWDTGRPLSEATRQRLEAKYNIDGSLGEQYATYLRNLTRGDLGISFANDRAVTGIIAERFPVSLHIGLYAFAFALVAGVGLGVLSAVHHRGPWDYAGVFAATAGAALPGFVLAPLLTWLLALKLGWFDVLSSDIGPISLLDWSWVWRDIQGWRALVLPVLALGFLPAAFITRVTRAAMLDVLSQEYVRTAHAKGLRAQVVVRRHVLRNALIPVVTIAGPVFAGLITGSFIVERAFEIPGLGRLFVQSVIARDYGLIMGTTIFFAVVMTLANLLVDLSYLAIDPRIRRRAR